MSENVGTILDIVGKMSEFVCKMLKIIGKCSQILEIYFTQKLGRKVSLKLTTTFFDFSDFRKHVNSIKNCRILSKIVAKWRILVFKMSEMPWGSLRELFNHCQIYSDLNFF